MTTPERIQAISELSRLLYVKNLDEELKKQVVSKLKGLIELL